jgi:hypothetical protein
VIRVKELSANDRHRILRHFLGLEDSDRLLRFGTVLPDALIRKYVESLDFSRDKVFGVFSHHFRLVGVGHLAFMARKDYDDNTEKRQVAEFGVSVSRMRAARASVSACFSAVRFIAAMPMWTRCTCIVWPRIRP